MTSDTPRTDRAVAFDDDGEMVSASFARSLERELQGVMEKLAESEVRNLRLNRLERELEEAMSNTPRTDEAEANALMSGIPLSMLCRQLERELAEANKLIASYETELSKEMPPDFKDWWENDKSEWPIVARLVLENRRKLASMGGEQ